MDAAALRASFPVFERIAYLNSGSDGPLPQVAADAARASIERGLTIGRAKEHFEARTASTARLRALYAELLHAPESEVAVTSSTSEGVAKAVAGLGLGPGDEILTSDAEHPGLVGPVLMAKQRGVTVRSGPLGTLADHITEQTSAIVCSHVGWHTGELADPRLGSSGVPLILDGAQGIGAVDVDPRALGCIAYAAAGQKWLCGADGTGMLWVDPDVELQAFGPGYTAFEDASLGLEGGIRNEASRFDATSLALELTAASVASTELLRSFGWESIFARAHEQAAWLAEELERRGKRVGPRGRTTLIGWVEDEPEATAARMADAGVAIRFLPATEYVRASVGAWNDESDLERLLTAL